MLHLHMLCPSFPMQVVKCSHGAVPIQQLFGKEAQVRTAVSSV